MGYYSTNLNMNNLDMFGNNWTYGSGIANIFSGVAGANSSIWTDYGAYNSVGGSSNSNSALGWAIAGIGVGMGTLLVTSLIGNSQSKKSAASAEESSKKSAFNSAIKQLGIDETDIDKIEQSTIDNAFETKSDEVDKKLKEPVTAAEQKITALKDERKTCVAGINTRLNNSDLYPKGSSTIKISEDNISLSDITNLIDKWEMTSTINDKGEKDSKLAERKENAIKILNEIKDELEKWVSGDKADKLKKAEEEKTKAEEKYNTEKTKEDEKLEKAKNTATEYLESYKSNKLIEDLDDADGTALDRLFGKRNANVSKDGTVEFKNDKDGNPKNELTDADLKSIFAKYRNGNKETKENIKKMLKEYKEGGKLSNCSEDLQNMAQKIIDQKIDAFGC